MKTLIKLSLLFVLYFGINLFAQEEKLDKYPNQLVESRQ